MPILTAYPQAGGGGGNITCDGRISNGTANQTWANKIAGAGTGVQTADTTASFIDIISGTASNTWSNLNRSIFTFDTASLGSTVIITSAILSIYISTKNDTIGWAPNIDVYKATPASNNNLVMGDFQQIGSVSQTGSPISFANCVVDTYVNFTFNATGISNINKTGVSAFGIRNQNYDVAGVQPSWSASQEASINCYFADNGSLKPKLVITYNSGGVSGFFPNSNQFVPFGTYF